MKNMQRHPYSELFGDMSEEEFEALKQDICDNGFQDSSIYVYEDKILDGWHRYRVYQETGLTGLEFTLFEGESPLQFVASANMHRRHLDPGQRAMIAVKHTKMLSDGQRKDYIRESGSSCDEPADRKGVAKQAGVGTATVDRAKQALEIAPEKADDIIAGKTTATKVIQEHKSIKMAEKRRELKENPPELPQNEYRTIVIDPPWEMDKISRDVRPNQSGFDYPTMSVDEIIEMNIPLAEDAFVFIWTTQKYLPDTFRIIEEWGLTYRFTMVWHKNGGIQPYNSAQFNCEFVVVGSIGNPKFVDLKAFNTAFNAERQGHSVKPEEFYSVIRRVTMEPRLDMFSRRKIEGFDVWGNEV